MAETRPKPRIQIGDATGSWRCVINDDTMTPKDIRLIHRAIDVAVGAARRGRRQRYRQQQITEREELRKAELEKAAQETLAAEKALENDTETSKSVDDASKAETEKADDAK